MGRNCGSVWALHYLPLTETETCQGRRKGPTKPLLLAFHMPWTPLGHKRVTLTGLTQILMVQYVASPACSSHQAPLCQRLSMLCRLATHPLLKGPGFSVQGYSNQISSPFIGNPVPVFSSIPGQCIRINPAGLTLSHHPVTQFLFSSQQPIF